MSVPVVDLFGWMASLLTLITFVQTSMITLRVTAILSNVFFIAYGAMGHVLPVLALHALLLPLNAARLVVHVGRSFVAPATAARDLPAGSIGRSARLSVQAPRERARR